MNVPQRFKTWDRLTKDLNINSLIKRGFQPIYVLTARYDSPIKLLKARQQFFAFAFGVDFVGRVADRNAALAPLNPVAIGTVDSADEVSVLKIWLDMPITRFEKPHLKDIPGEIFAELTGCKVDFQVANDCGTKFEAAIAKARKSDCCFIYPSAAR